MTSVAPDLAAHLLGERFWSKVAVNDETGCWEWTASMANGYGKYWTGARHSRRLIGSHRFAYEALVGPIPEGLHLDHLCRNPSCVNPIHLEPVTCRENLLRGVGVSAHAAAATHCPHGHPYSGENLYISPRGDRGCKACRYAQANASRMRMRLAQGKTAPVDNKTKTHCPAGHEYTPENTYTDKINRRSCKACGKIRSAERSRERSAQ